MKLDSAQKHVLNLIARDAGPDGWATVSEMLYKPISSNIPPELAEFEKLEKGGRVRSTPAGVRIIDAMAWL